MVYYFSVDLQNLIGYLPKKYRYFGFSGIFYLMINMAQLQRPPLPRVRRGSKKKLSTDRFLVSFAKKK